MDENEFWKIHTEVTDKVRRICPPEAFTNVMVCLQNLRASLPLKDNYLWLRFVESNPIFERVLLFTYSPPEMIDLRFQILNVSDLLWDATQVWKVIEIGDLQESLTITSFLKNTVWLCGIVAAVDRQKRYGNIEGSIEELRDRLFRVETKEDANRKITKIIRNEIPWIRSEHVLMKDEEGRVSQELHIYLLDDKFRDEIFDNWLDEACISWVQCFTGFPQLWGPAYAHSTFENRIKKGGFDSLDTKAFFYDRNGNLLIPPEKRRNPVEIALRQKYDPLIKCSGKKYRVEDDDIRIKYDEKDGDMIRKLMKDTRSINQSWDAEKIFIDAVMNWKEGYQPPAHFQKALEWGFKHLGGRFDKRFYKKSELLQVLIASPPLWNPLEDDSETEFISQSGIEHMGGSFDELDDEGNKRIDISADLPEPATNIDEKLLFKNIEEFLLSLDHQADRFIFIDMWKSCQEDQKPMSFVNIAQELKKRGVKITPQRVGQRHKSLMLKARKFFAVFKK